MGECSPRVRAGGLGININNLSFDALNSPSFVSAITQSGTGWIRISLFWGFIEQQRGVFKWPAAADRGLAILQAEHVNVLLTVSGPVPCWALQSNSSHPCTNPRETIPSSGPWADFVRAAVTRYGNKVHYWEIWNEPDLHNGLDTPDNRQRLIDYRDDILIPGAVAIHAADPTAKVVAPAFATNGAWGTAPGPNLAQALKVVLEGAAGHNVDVVSFHSYVPPNNSSLDPLELGMAAHTVLREIGMDNKPLWLTEVGIGIRPSVLQPIADYRDEQASLIREDIAQALSERIFDKVFWFALTDSAGPVTDSANPGNRAHRDAHGLIDNSDYTTYPWTPRPAFTAFQQLARNSCGK